MPIVDTIGFSKVNSRLRPPPNKSCAASHYFQIFQELNFLLHDLPNIGTMITDYFIWILLLFT